MSIKNQIDELIEAEKYFDDCISCSSHNDLPTPLAYYLSKRLIKKEITRLSRKKNEQ